MIVKITEPPVQNGQVLLRRGDDMWMYLPKSRRLIRIGARDRSLGGEASNTDLMRIDLSLDYDAAFMGYDTLDGEKCYRLELDGKSRSVAYDNITYWISVGRELPVRRDFYSLSGKKLKTMFFSDVQTIGEYLLPKKALIVNENNSDYQTELIILKMDPSPSFDDAIFNPNYVKTGRL
jgi:outer membrane lipoprotein-sorting protein